MKWNLSWKTISLLGFILAQSCATSEPKTDEELLRPKNADNVVVQKIGSTETVLSPYGRGHWISAVESEDKSMKHIQGLLAFGKGVNAERAARKYLEEKPGDVQGLIALSSALALSKQFDLAAYYGKLVSKKLPSNSLSLNIAALSTLVQARTISDYRRVEKLLATAFESSPSEIAAGLNLGSIYLDLGDAQSAYETYSKTLSRCEKCFPTIMGTGIAARRTNRTDEAINHFKKALSLDEDNPEALYQLALVYKNNLKDNDNSISALEKIISGNKANSVLKGHAHTLLRSIKSLSTKSSNEEDEDLTKDPLPEADVKEEPSGLSDEEIEEMGIEDEPDDFTLEKDK